MSSRTSPASRLAVLAVATLALGACGGTVDFSVDKDIDVDSTVASGSGIASVDLAASAGSAWKQRKHVSSVSIQAASATVTDVKAANTALTASGTVWLLPEGVTAPSATNGSVQAGAWTGVAVAKDAFIDLAPSAELDDFVRKAFDGSGKFSVYATDGSTTGGSRVAVTLHVVLDAKLKWKAF